MKQPTYNAFRAYYYSVGPFTEFNNRGEKVKIEYYNMKLLPLGPCKDMAEAKRLFGGAPVLEEAR